MSEPVQASQTETEVEEREGVLIGPLRRPQNPGQEGPNSIHNDAIAKPLGFRGGTIAGSLHMEQFPPLLLRAFGPRWLERGGLSLYFLNATTHLEPVRAFVRRPEQPGSDAQVEVWMEREDGLRVCEGTASAGTPEQTSALRARVERLRPPGDVRILRALQPGQTMPPTPARIDGERLDERIALTTEVLPEYREPALRGGRVLSPALVVQALRRAEAGLELDVGRAVGLFGAIEIEHLKGPVFADRDYVASGRVLAVGDTPKSELYWYESVLDEPGGGPASPRDGAGGPGHVARMIMLLRFMKASSPLWQ